MYYVYILYSESIDRFYIGYTHNLEKRLNRHNLGLSQSTRRGIPWVIKYSQAFENKTDAIKRERFIKSQKSRKFITQLIS